MAMRPFFFAIKPPPRSERRRFRRRNPEKEAIFRDDSPALHIIKRLGEEESKAHFFPDSRISYLFLENTSFPLSRFFQWLSEVRGFCRICHPLSLRGSVERAMDGGNCRFFSFFHRANNHQVKRERHILSVNKCIYCNPKAYGHGPILWAIKPPPRSERQVFRRRNPGEEAIFRDNSPRSCTSLGDWERRNQKPIFLRIPVSLTFPEKSPPFSCFFQWLSELHGFCRICHPLSVRGSVENAMDGGISCVIQATHSSKNAIRKYLRSNLTPKCLRLDSISRSLLCRERDNGSFKMSLSTTSNRPLLDGADDIQHLASIPLTVRYSSDIPNRTPFNPNLQKTL
ncbi:hypothetical protein CEXT_460181 [Caerostris extrusa]|uniref:Uncharacterized protein n=1 Tax=Caerostris extrusa TaxID=172846 RepID=A0AAV4WDC0_CAEEX|nr:hypothetical protein CEXT_460181 [Caerostris extrusa]